MLTQGHRDLIYPRIPGHEMVGRIIEIDADCVMDAVRGRDGKSPSFEEGDLVAVWPGIACGKCSACQSGAGNRCHSIRIMGFSYDGGFAEMCALPAQCVSSGLSLLPGGFDPAIATLAEPLACCINGQEQSHLARGESVLILGGGPIGALNALLAKFRGASLIIIAERLPGRIQILKKNIKPTEATEVTIFNPDDEALSDLIAAETNGQGVDAILTATPEVDIDSSLLQLLSEGGRVCVFSGPKAERSSKPLDLSLIHYREISICGSYGCSSRQIREAVGLLTSGQIRPDWLITKRTGLSQIKEAFDHSIARSGMKSLVCMNENKAGGLYYEGK